MIHMKVKPFLHVNHNVWFLFIVVFLNESRETAWEMYLPLLCHWGWKRRHEWTQDLYFCANNSKKWGPELVKRGPERTQDLYSGLYSEKGRSWVSEKRSRADSGPLFWTLQWKREVLSLWKELLRVSHFLKLLLQKPPLFLHHGEQCGPQVGRRGQVRTEEAEIALTTSFLRKSLSVCGVRSQARLLLGRLDVLGPGAAAAALRRNNALQLERRWAQQRRADALSSLQGRSILRRGHFKMD